jgi:hypothetical protein
LRADTLGEARAPGRVAVRPGRPGIDFVGRDFFYLVGLPEGLLCSLGIESSFGSSPPAGVSPASFQSAPMRIVDPPQVALQDVFAIAGGGHEFVLRILPAEATGEVLLADSLTRIFERYRVPDQPSATERALEVAVVLAEGENELLVGHELADGRRSEWRHIELRPDLL